jgi:predicted transcriptional regulator
MIQRRDYESFHKLDKTLITLISNCLGIRYRELLRMTKSCHGVLSYHLAELEKSNIIRADRKISITRYYLSDIPSEVSKVIGYLHNPTSRQIISKLAKESCTFIELCKITEKASSTIYWHIKDLIKNKIISRTNAISDSNMINRRLIYSVCDKPVVLDVLQKYPDFSMVKVIDNYSQIVDSF